MRNDDEDEDEKTPAAPKDGGPSAMLIQKKFLEQRKIFLWGAVTDETAKDITEKLLYLEAVGPGQEIHFYMNTPGGSITAGLAIYDTMQLIKPDIATVCVGRAASMATVLLLVLVAGLKVDRPMRRVRLLLTKAVETLRATLMR